MKTMQLILAAALLAACSQTGATQYHKAGTSAADVERDMRVCKFEAARSDVDVMHTTWQSELQQMSLIKLCMQAKGYD